MRPELPTAVAVHNSASIQPARSIFISWGKSVQISGATSVDYATVFRWAIKMVPVLAAIFRWRKHSVGKSCRIDETYIKVAGEWKYLYLAVDRAGDTADFLQTAKGDLTATGNFCLFLKDKCHVSVYKSNSGLSNGKKVKPSQTICAMPVVTAIAVRKSTFLYLAKPIGTC